MERRRIGKTAVEVSAIGLASAGGPALLNAALNRGITLFDSAGCRSLPALVRCARRDSIQIADDYAAGNSPAAVRGALEQSLARLGTDYIDLYMGRDVRLSHFRDDVSSELEKLMREGKLRAWGVALGPGIGWREEGVAATLERGADVVQTVFSIFEQDPGREFCQVARSGRAGVLAVPDDSAATPQKLARLRPYADARGLTPRQLALRWLLMDSAVATIALSPGTVKEIESAVSALDAPPLTLDEMRRLADDYADDWGLGPAAHPRDLGSSVSPTGKVRSGYVPPPVLLA